MKINNSLDVARWESLDCKCGKDVNDSFPIKECLHCSFDQRWQSVPQKDFKVNEPEMKNDKPTGKTITREIKEITLHRGDRYEDVIGWSF
jgi:hypothetical protein|tara:strand:+ start:506 stop:775 length:270 start_codon:yes stop_codon:yes gene_type:complete